jgi:recombination protein RecR
MLGKSITNLMQALKQLPAIGPKSAQRMALCLLLEHNHTTAKKIITNLTSAVNNVRQCSCCQMLTEDAVCVICNDPRRDSRCICIVSSPADCIAIEESSIYKGKYFILTANLSPIDGIGPEELGIDNLLIQIENNCVSEIILATSTTPEGEATAYYLSEQLKKYKLNISRLAQGIPRGGELEYIDSDTLAHALDTRKQFI